jgi:nucleoid DNA-binding protein
MSEKPEFFPNIDEVNAENYDGQPITLENLDLLIYKIIAKTGLTYDQTSYIVKLYFNEIRKEILNGKTVYMGESEVGYFKLILKRLKNKKYRISLKFKASKQIIKKAKYYAILGR